MGLPWCPSPADLEMNAQRQSEAAARAQVFPAVEGATYLLIILWVSPAATAAFPASLPDTLTVVGHGLALTSGGGAGCWLGLLGSPACEPPSVG